VIFRTTSSRARTERSRLMKVRRESWIRRCRRPAAGRSCSRHHHAISPCEQVFRRAACGQVPFVCKGVRVAESRSATRPDSHSLMAGLVCCNSNPRLRRGDAGRAAVRARGCAGLVGGRAARSLQRHDLRGCVFRSRAAGAERNLVRAVVNGVRVRAGVDRRATSRRNLARGVAGGFVRPPP
jgi:hypothetical protein